MPPVVGPRTELSPAPPQQRTPDRSPGRDPLELHAEVALVHTVGPATSRHWLEAMRRDGLVVPVGQDAYLRADAVDWPFARRVVIARQLPPDAVLAGTCAVWALGGPCRSGLTAPESLLVIVPPHTRARPTPGLTCYRTALDARDVTTVDGLALTTDARTLADLLLLGDDRDDAALAWLLAHREVEPADAAAVLRRRSHTRGIRRATAALQLVRDGVPAPLAHLSLPGQAWAGA